MKIWQKLLIPTLITLTIGGVYLFFVFRHRQDPGLIGKEDASQALTKDDVAIVRSLFTSHFEDTKQLEGTTVWMKNGYTISYYPYAGGRVDFAKRVGLVPAAQRLEIKKIVKAQAPAAAHDGMEPGGKQAFVVFALKGGKDLFATPIGTMQTGDESYYCDILFYYDDPHTIYDNWPKDVWAAIDAHQVKQGMSELETRMSIGQKMHGDGQIEGDRTVTYEQDGKVWTITYVKNRATKISTTAKSE